MQRPTLLDGTHRAAIIEIECLAGDDQIGIVHFKCTTHSEGIPPENEYFAKKDESKFIFTVIVIVGHIVVPGILWIETNYTTPVWLSFAAYLPFTFVASLSLLQPVKGAVVGLQWALRMHGFDENPPDGIPPV